ncbi:MAG: DNA methyltransferase [Lysobacterales bacterium]|nr:MAG: DNA methyltransferase [Xanthomonadales bacterium]
MNLIQPPGQVLKDPFSSGRRYSVVYADPPWRYRDQAGAGARGALYKYPLLSDKDIADLPVAQIAAEHAALFLWATWPKLLEMLPIIDAWGMGSWTRANTEPCLLATCGKPKRVSAAVHQVVESTSGAHSKKPIEVQERIVNLMRRKMAENGDSPSEIPSFGT